MLDDHDETSLDSVPTVAKHRCFADVQPRAERLRAADGVRLRGEDQEGRLEGVLRVGRFAQVPPADAPH